MREEMLANHYHITGQHRATQQLDPREEK